MMATQTSNLTPAFRGAPFNSSGSCMHHPEVKLSQKVNLNGRVVYKELRRVCPKCSNSGNSHNKGDCGSVSSAVKASDRMNSVGSLNKSARSNFSSGTGGASRRSDGTGTSSHREGSVKHGSVRSGTPGRERGRERGVEKRPSCTSDSTLGQSSSRSRPRSTSRSRTRGRSDRCEDEGSRQSRDRSRSRARSKSRDRSRAPSVGRNGPSTSKSGGRSTKSRREFEVPFDSKGRCHYHSQVQLAKKKLMGGWNVLLDVCPKCMEEDYNDDKSVASGRSNRSVRSARSARSTKSTKSSGGRVFSKNKNLYESPFDSNGYCHRHSHVRLAKKKTLGGWKIIQSFCTDCAKEDANNDSCSDKSGRSRRSICSRRSRMSKSSRRSGRSRYEDDETESAHSTSQSEQVKKKLVKKMRFRDAENGEEGLYTGYVNGEYQPHGRGKIVYQNGDRFDGTWCEGSKVHGKTNKSKSSSSSGKSRRGEEGSHQTDKISNRRISHDGSASTGRPKPQDGNANTARSKTQEGSTSTGRPKLQQAQSAKKLDEYREMYTDAFPVILEAKKVKGMRFVDYYGDPGRYSGEVNDANMPHGMGEMTYDHGLVQSGKWTNGVLDEGSIVSCPRSPRKGATDSSLSGAGSTSRGNRVRDP